MRSRGGAGRHTGDVSLIDVRRTFRGTKDRGQDPTERLLLAIHLQGRPPFLLGMPTMSSGDQHLQARRDADAADPWGGNLRPLGDRFHGTFPTFWRERVYLGGGGLCVQVGRSNSHQDKRSSGGTTLHHTMHLRPIRLSESYHQRRRLTLQQLALPGAVEEIRSTPPQYSSPILRPVDNSR